MLKPTLGHFPRSGTLKNDSFMGVPSNCVLVAYGNAAAFNTNYHLWSDGGGNPRMLEKAQAGRLEVRVYMGASDSVVDEYNEGYEETFSAETWVVVGGWDAEKHGLIYTDETFEESIGKLIKKFKIPGDVYYTEQGMQGDNYVSMSGDEKTFNWLVKKYGKKLWFDSARRKKIIDQNNKDVNQVIDTLKSFKIGARRINDTWRGATLVYSKKMTEVVEMLREDGWNEYPRCYDTTRIRMCKNHMKVAVEKRNYLIGSRIYINSD